MEISRLVKYLMRMRSTQILSILKAGCLECAYQTFVDAIALIDEIELDEQVKDIKKEKVLKARKLAIGPAFQGFPVLYLPATRSACTKASLVSQGFVDHIGWGEERDVKHGLKIIKQSLAQDTCE